ncbi:hypothetical protein RE628_19975 [Paenibacillus sp. D2_2]|uniref:hypothetical protein n=1 Tax=Paenibacillus sp. D2_2 TaxID=3073092 RepID=UPI0028149AEE|nr:hypothetical protein [Paenibacillus sp. D2_2]WMT39663.1 hypothetical protein RE628_19975 [Paenibacillus sp. D2_2]
MLKKVNVLLIIIVILGLQMGCSEEGIKGNENEAGNITVATEVEDAKNSIHIPFKQHLYSKDSSNFSWGWSNTEDLPKEIIERYEDFKNSAPGRFIVKETSTSISYV